MQSDTSEKLLADMAKYDAILDKSAIDTAKTPSDDIIHLNDRFIRPLSRETQQIDMILDLQVADAASPTQMNSDENLSDERNKPQLSYPPLSATQYWMPDHLCRVCYDCALSFTFFRRRHHCRLCGQIFCYECSDHFVDPTSHGFPPGNGLIRICNFCFRYIDSDQKAVNERKASVRVEDALRKSVFDEAREGLDTPVRDDVYRRSLILPSLEKSEQYPRLSSSSSNSSQKSDGSFASIDAAKIKDNILYPYEQSIDDLPEDHGGNVAMMQKTQSKQVERRKSRRRSSMEVLDAVSRASCLLDEAPDLSRTRMNSVHEEETSISLSTPRDNFHQEFKKPLEQLHISTARDRIVRGIQMLTEKAWSSDMNHCPLDQKKEFENVFLELCDAAMDTLLDSMNFRNAGGFNYECLLKITCIQAGSVGDLCMPSYRAGEYGFKLYAAAIFRKHLCHKSMARHIQNPRVLLLAGGISYDRTFSSGRLTSLDTLMEQEKSYMKILVEKICALQPDLIFVGRTVSRVAQELLRERGIAVVLNVKRSILERIARHTGASILLSTDHVDQADPSQVIGTCGEFEAKTFPAISDSVAEEKSASDSETLTSKVIGPRSRAETYLYLDHCEPSSGYTCVIMGPDQTMLKSIKRMLKDVFRMSYNIALDGHVLSALRVNPAVLHRMRLQVSNPNEVSFTSCHLRVLDDSHDTKPRYVQCTFAKELQVILGDSNDISLGTFIAQGIRLMDKKCPNSKCNYEMADHVQTFNAGGKTLVASFEQLPEQSSPIPTLGTCAELESETNAIYKFEGIQNAEIVLPLNLLSPKQRATLNENVPDILHWRWCQACKTLITPISKLQSRFVYKFSFGRFLHMCSLDLDQSFFFSGNESLQCAHTSEDHVLFFCSGQWVVRLDAWYRKPLKLPSQWTQWPKVCEFGETFDLKLHTDSSKKINLLLKHVRQLKAEIESILTRTKSELDDQIEKLRAFISCISKRDALRIRSSLELVCLIKLLDANFCWHKSRVTETYNVLDDQLSWENLCALCKKYEHLHRSMYQSTCSELYSILYLRKITKQYLSKSCTLESSVPFSATTRAMISFGRREIPQDLVHEVPLDRRSTDDHVCTRISLDMTSQDVASVFSLECHEASVNTSGENKADVTAEIDAKDSSLYSSSEDSNATMPILFTPSILNLRKESARHSIDTAVGWRTKFTDLHKAVSRQPMEQESFIDFPIGLTTGHPSLTLQTTPKSYVPVYETLPVTFVAFMLSSKEYEEALDTWKIQIHEESTACIKPSQNCDNAYYTSWIQAALNSKQVTLPFKYVAEETPIHSCVMEMIAPRHVKTILSPSWEFSCVALFPLQFQVLRDLVCGNHDDFIFSIAHVDGWETSGGKSGAFFCRSIDHLYVIKHITATELQSFMDVLPEYFHYLACMYFEQRQTLLARIFGLYHTTITNKSTGSKSSQAIIIMENIFEEDTSLQVYDVKGSTRNRYIERTEEMVSAATDTDTSGTDIFSDAIANTTNLTQTVLLDGNLTERSRGHPFGMINSDFEKWWKAIQNDARFLASIRIIDYSLILGFMDSNQADDEGKCILLASGIVDYLRQFDLMKRVESVGKSVGMITGKAPPTIIEPTQYASRFLDAIQRYVMPIPEHITENYPTESSI